MIRVHVDMSSWFNFSRPRWTLHVQAQALRQLMEVGMILHRVGEPKPPSPAFSKFIPTTIASTKGTIELVFYTPKDYSDRDPGKRYPALVNFHGGGFTLGRATDDARWAAAVVQEVGAVVVSVEYRLAPENPFPTSVEDGADAILYLLQHADVLGIDKERIGTSGFSAGGNLAFTVPMKLQAELKRRNAGTVEQGKVASDALGVDGRMATIVAWYPSTDFATNTRAERRASNLRPEKELPQLFTDLFDASYLYPPHEVSMSDPYLSPGLASEAMLRALPNEIIMYTCEWDELLVESERFRDRLRTELGKKVIYRKVEGVMHAWDKSPNLALEAGKREEIYSEVCSQIKRIFEQ